VVVDLPVESDGDDRYDAVGRELQGWLADGTLERDPRPSFTIYRMAYTDDRGRPATTLGVIGALELSRPGEGEILPHEHTTPKAKSDRLDLLRGSRANLSAVWGLSLTKGLADLLVVDDPPLADWTDADGVEHTVWRVDDPVTVEGIARAVGASPVVIADGHHRYETSLAYRDERRDADGGDAGAAESTLCFVVELVEGQLTVRPIHRLLSGLPDGTDAAALLGDAGLLPDAEVPAEDVASGAVLDRMADAGALALVRPDGSAVLLRPDAARFADVADLDSARLAQALSTLPAHEVRYQHGVDRVLDAVGSRDAQWGVLLRPAAVAQIHANAHAGERMPPKTTFFHPKPKTGIVFRSLD